MKIKKLLSVSAIMWVATLMILSSCTTQKKAIRWFNEHETEAAKYCAVKFPVSESVDTSFVIDSAGYEAAYWELWHYADSLLNERSKVEHDTAYIERIRESIKTEIKWRLKPCVDSVKVVTKTVENTAKVKYLTGKLDEQITVITNMYNRNNELQQKITEKNRVLWIMWIVIIGFLLWFTRRLWMPLLSKLT